MSLLSHSKESLELLLNSGFSHNQLLIALNNGDIFQATLLKELYYRKLDGYLITIPSGFQTDFASVPRAFRNIINVWGLHGLSAVLHDFLYSKQGADFCNTRKEADFIFYESMVRIGVSKVRAYTMYKSVRLFGGGHFER